MAHPPFVLDKGIWKGVLYLTVLSGGPNIRAYGIQFDCEMYFGIGEMIYSMSEHGDAGSWYDGDVYIKETVNSALLKAYALTNPLEGVPRHFLFVGNDFCYECVGFGEPIIQAFATADEAYDWRPDQSD